jgi:hypothetical protein
VRDSNAIPPLVQLLTTNNLKVRCKGRAVEARTIGRRRAARKLNSRV